MQCSKTIIGDLFDQTGVWTGPDAKWFENCGKTPIVQADFNTWNLFAAVSQQIKWGTAYPNSEVYCHPLPVVGSKGSALNEFTRLAFNRFGSYWLGSEDSDALAVMQDITSHIF
jgi:hypothetical protein